MTITFPETLAPNFFHVDKLPDYGLKLLENELGREIRRYTEDTGYKTELKIQYNGLRSAEVKALTAFYLQVKGTFDKFTLPINFYRSPSSITNSLTDLADTTEWRFMNPPMIQTVISDIYTVEIRLLSLKDSLNPDSSKIIGFVNSVNVDFILPTILIPQKQVRELVPIALEFIISSIDLNQSVTVNSIDLTLETSELTFTTSTSVDSRSIQSLSLSFVASQTGFVLLLNIKSGLISWWDLKEISNNRLDSHGTNHLTPTNVSYRNFLSTASPNFQSQLSVTNNSTIQLASKDFTICCSVALFQSPSVNSNYFFLFSKDNISTAGREWALYTTSVSDPIPNRFIFVIYNQNVGGTLDSIDTGQNLSLNTFYWVVCKYDKTSKTISIRVNNGGVVSKTYNNTITHSNTQSPLRLSGSVSNFYGLNGAIAKACIYEKILSSQEEDFLWNNGKLREYHEL